MLLGHTRPLPCKPGITTGCLDLRFGFARTWPALDANLKGPCLCAQGPRMLPAFGRSWEDDREEKWQGESSCGSDKEAVAGAMPEYSK